MVVVGYCVVESYDVEVIDVIYLILWCDFVVVIVILVDFFFE